LRRRPTCKPEAICRFCQFTLQAAVGCIRQAGIRRPGTGAPIPWTLYSPRRH
jgi:hypothetical protein